MKQAEKMSLKKRMFQSNMAMVVSVLIAFMLVIGLALVVFEDSFEKRLEQADVWQPQIDAGQDTADGMTEINGAAEESGAAGEGLTDSEQIKIWIKQEVRRLFVPILLAFFFISICTIVMLLLLASLFTKKMNQMVMKPLGLLLAAAKRVQNGNLTDKISYQGETEFETVCEAFNAMQQTILEEQKQRAANEKARIDMVTGISHDLRTPLTSIQGYIKGVLDGIANTPQKQELYLKTAYTSTLDMNVLLQKLFDFSKIESGQMPFHKVYVDLNEFSAAYAAQKETVLAPEQVRFATEWDENIPEILLDVEQVRRIFDNLLENSIKYSSVSPVVIKIRTAFEEEGVVLEWHDNGRGVPDEKLGAVFDKFYRCDEARTEKGSGVGLYVVKYIMERHNGSVTAGNENGFVIRLVFPAGGKERESVNGENFNC